MCSRQHVLLRALHTRRLLVMLLSHHTNHAIKAPLWLLMIPRPAQRQHAGAVARAVGNRRFVAAAAAGQPASRYRVVHVTCDV